MKRMLTAAAVLMSVAAAPVLVHADVDQGWKRQSKPEKLGKQDRPNAGEGRGGAFRGSPPAYAVPTWRRGQVLPPRYRDDVVVEPRRYGLYAPPSGSRWVRVGDDAYLTRRDGVVREVLRDSW